MSRQIKYISSESQGLYIFFLHEEAREEKGKIVGDLMKLEGNVDF